MKRSELMTLIQEQVDAVVAVLEEVFKTDIEPLTQFGNPEKVIGKKYDDWTTQELQRASQIYGHKLEDFIAKQEIKKLEQLEAEEV